MTHYLYILLSLILLQSCSSNSSNTTSQTPDNQPVKIVPTFVADSAYAAVERQLAFGPRVPGTEAQQQCAQWMEAELRRYGAEVRVMHTKVTAYDGTQLPCINLVASYNIQSPNRVLLMAHWDSRHVADADPNPNKQHLPVPAANDGASGVGVLLEIARQAGLKTPRLGIDIFLTDAEDYGAPNDWKGTHEDKHWGLGTQAWCKQPHVTDYRASYGILLDMVGAGDATFYREYFSDQYASDVVNLVWQTAARLGYKNLFVDQRGPAITDDHVFVNRMSHIPTIDIIDTRTDNSTFYPYWHTTDDTLDKISAETLQKVGNVLMHLIY